MLEGKKRAVTHSTGTRAEDNIPLRKKQKKLLLIFLLAIAILCMSATAIMLFSTNLSAKASFGINPFVWSDQWRIYMTTDGEHAKGIVTVSDDKTQLEFTAHNVDFTDFNVFGKLTFPVDFKLVNAGLQHALVEFDTKDPSGNSNILDSIVITDITGDSVVLEYSRSTNPSDDTLIHARKSFELNSKSIKTMRLDVTLRLTQGMVLTGDNNSFSFVIPFEAIQNPDKIAKP